MYRGILLACCAFPAFAADVSYVGFDMPTDRALIVADKLEKKLPGASATFTVTIEPSIPGGGLLASGMTKVNVSVMQRGRRYIGNTIESTDQVDMLKLSKSALDNAFFELE